MTMPRRRGTFNARNLFALAALIAIVIAIVFILNRPQPNAVIVSKDLTPPMPGSALAEQYPLTSMLFIADIRNDGAAADFDIKVEINDGSQTWKRTTQITLAKDQTEQIIIDFGPLEGVRNELKYEVHVTPR